MGQHAPLLALAQELDAAHGSTRAQSYAGAAARVAIQLLHTGHLDVADALLARAEAAAAPSGPRRGRGTGPRSRPGDGREPLPGARHPRDVLG